MVDKNISRDSKFFFENSIKKGNNPREKARILCMIDSTGSMNKTLDQVQGKVMDMIDVLASKFSGQF